MSDKVTDSQFAMWRTLFALAHVDRFVSNDELRFMAEALEDIPFSDDQKSILTQDIKEPQDVFEMYLNIEDDTDRIEFFRFAHDMVWVDGDFGPEEQKIMLKLQEEQVRRTDISDLVGKVNLRLEGEYDPDENRHRPGKRDAKKIIHSFRERFLKDLFR
ncbi:MAG: TerB family tellurite resistance protein [Alphaproteobacteria bacterium]|nr:TerB family tellurite resistance protein [Alphaproteobacteria bacterium]MCD8526559.1 TerB family tellurite resistance protein [Alphaproteobacteria bacterium]MCD8571327.1 TerB family tellurite resistance protein [Alphaproteobacteria bacterium]